MTKFKIVWFWDSGRQINPDFKHVMSFYDDSYEKPSFINNIKSPSHNFAHSFNHLNDDGNMMVCLVSDDFNTSIPLWYVYVDEPGNPHMRSIVAYADNRHRDGLVINYSEALKKNILFSESAGFIKWFVEDSRVQQVFVSPDQRRKRISTKLFAVADIMIVSSTSWNGIFLNGGDITTADGEILRSAWSNSARVTERQGSVNQAFNAESMNH